MRDYSAIEEKTRDLDAKHKEHARLSSSLQTRMNIEQLLHDEGIPYDPNGKIKFGPWTRWSNKYNGHAVVGVTMDGVEYTFSAPISMKEWGEKYGPLREKKRGE